MVKKSPDCVFGMDLRHLHVPLLYSLLQLQFLYLLLLKGNGNVISLRQRRFPTVPLKTLSDQVWTKYQCLQFWKLLTFNCGFSTMRISTAGKYIGIITNKHFQILKNDNISHIMYQIKVSRVPLWIGHCHLCVEGNLKLHLHSL